MADVSSLRSWTDLGARNSSPNGISKLSYSPSSTPRTTQFEAVQTMPHYASSTSASSQTYPSEATAQQHSEHTETRDTERPANQLARHSIASHATRSFTQESSEEEVGDIYKELKAYQELAREASESRSNIINRRRELYSLDRADDEEEEKVLKETRLVLASSDSNTGPTLIDSKLLSDLMRVLSRKRDNRGPLMDDIHQLEQRLDVVNYKLQQAEQSLQRHYFSAQRVMANLQEPAADHSAYEGDRQYLQDDSRKPVPLEESHDADSDYSEIENDAIEPTIYRPMNYHPKYAYWQQRVGEVKLLEERIWNLEYREEKLKDRKTKRDSVDLHLLKEDEEELERLPSAIAKLMTELDESEEEIDKLREECLFLGIIDADGEPVEKLTADEEKPSNQAMLEDITRERQNESEQTPALEAWVIRPARRNRNKRRLRRSRWINSKEYQKSLSEQDIMREMKKLDIRKKGSLEERLRALTDDQSRQVEHVRWERNRRELDSSKSWKVGQVAWSREIIGAKQNGQKVSVIIVYLVRDQRPEPEPEPEPTPPSRQTPSSANYGDRPPSTRSSPGLHDESMTSISTRRGRHSPIPRECSLEECSLERSQQNAAVTSLTQLELRNSFQPLDKARDNSMSGRISAFPATTLIPSVATNGYLDVEVEAPSYGGLQSRIGPWMFHMLEISHAEVKLLATILQAMGVLLLEERAAEIMRRWDSNVQDIKLHPRSKRTALVILEAGYDRGLLEKVMEKPQTASCLSKADVTCGFATHRDSTI